MDEQEPSRPYVTVQHCLLVRQGMPDESYRTEHLTPYQLRGVSYHYRVPSDTEFPNDPEGPWAVYLRVTGQNAGPTRVLFRVLYLNPRDGWQEISRIPCWTTIPLPETDAATRDVVLNLPHLRLGGMGLHAITVHFWYDGVELDLNDQFQEDSADEGPDWETIPDVIFRIPDWLFGAVEHFWIERLP